MKTSSYKQLLAGLVGFGLVTLHLAAAPYTIREISFISFGGGATLNGSLSDSTAFESYFGLNDGKPTAANNFIVPATGSYATVPDGIAVTFTPFAFNVQPASPFILWSFSDGSTDYRFEIASIDVVRQDEKFLNIKGTGTAYISDEPTPGTWSITSTGDGNVVTFGAVTMVPEPSSAALALGLGSVLLAFRRFRA